MSFSVCCQYIYTRYIKKNITFLTTTDFPLSSRATLSIPHLKKWAFRLIYCKIFNSPEMNHKEVKNSIISFFVENRVCCLEGIYQNEKVAENIYPLFKKLFELTEKEVCCELEDLGWI